MKEQRSRAFLIVIVNALVLSACGAFGVYVLSDLYWRSGIYYGPGFSQGWAIFTFLGSLVVSVVGGIIIIANIRDKRFSRVKKVGLAYAILGVALSLSFIPFFSVSGSVEVKFKQEFASAWGDSWEDRVGAPSIGPWLTGAYSFRLELFGLPIDKSAFTITRDIEFQRIDDDRFLFDAYVPTSSGLHPVILNIHGGGFIGGNKSESFTINRLQYMASAGYVVFSINYGTLGESGINTQYNISEMCENIARFSDWMAENGSKPEYKADVNRTFIMGFSAGGCLSALVAYGRDSICAWNHTVQLVGGIHVYPVVNMSLLSPEKLALLLASGIFEESDMNTYSPIAYIKENSSNLVPNLLFQGELDKGVSPVEARRFAGMCDDAGMKSVYLEFPRGDHVFDGPSKGLGAQATIWAMERFCQLVLDEVAS